MARDFLRMKKQRESLTKDEILDVIRKQKDILAKYKVREIGLFGSFVRGEQGDRSDIDLILVKYTPQLAGGNLVLGFQEDL